MPTILIPLVLTGIFLFFTWIDLAEARRDKITALTLAALALKPGLLIGAVWILWHVSFK